MTDEAIFAVEPWSVTEPRLRLDRLALSESVFALSNGHIGVRGNLDEGEPHHTSGTYLNGFYEALPLPYAESGYGYPEQGQTLINVTDGKLMRLLVDDEPFDLRHGVVVEHERVLDLRHGVLRRTVEWISPAGRAIRVRSIRLVSFVQRAILAVSYEVEAVDQPVRIVLQSSLVANEPLSEELRPDPRAAAALRSPLIGEYHRDDGVEVALGHRSRVSGLRVVAALDHTIEGPAGTKVSAESEPDLARVTVNTELQPGATLRIVKLLGYGWSAQRSMPALRDQVDAAVAAARHTGWDGLVKAQRDYLAEVWDCADVEIDGDAELQQAVRFALFQVIQAGARAERRGIPAKGLTGRGYDGHSFWDSEMYALRVLTYTAPQAARDALLWRHSTLPLALERAQLLRLSGAAFPWRTIHGEECSGYWPAGTAAFHVNAAIADAVRRYVGASDDKGFEEGAGLDLLVQTARLWAALGHHDAEGCFRIDGVTGPDEYSALVDNNVYTNLMAAKNLLAAADATERHPRRAGELQVEAAEIASWRSAADAVVVPYDAEVGVTAQSEGFTRYRHWDFDATPPDRYPLLLHYPYYLLYSSQVVKQADLVLAIYCCGDRFTAEQKRRDFAYYERITVRDSTLSASIQAIVAAEVGHTELAYEYLRESALVDLRDRTGNTGEGLHLASLAGAWMAVVDGFGGLRDDGRTLSFSPTLPPQLTRLKFGVLYRGRQLRVEIVPGAAHYELMDGPPLEVLHHGQLITVAIGSTVTAPWTEHEPPAEPVTPPPGREPTRTGVGADQLPHFR